MRDLGDHHLNSAGTSAPVQYGTNPHDPVTWDADMVTVFICLYHVYFMFFQAKSRLS